MNETQRNIYYYADLTATAEKVLIPGIKDHSFQLLHGPRSSGKSTLCDVTASLVKDNFTVISVDFQRVTLNKGDDVFWKSFGRELSRLYSFIPKIVSPDDFSDLFSQTNWKEIIDSSDVAKAKGIVPGKPVLLVIDEFDTLYSLADEATRQSVLSTLRGIKQDQEDFSLRSFVGIGTFSILKLTGGIGISPFSIRDAVPCPDLTEGQVEVLFKEYADDKSKTIGEDVISDIYYRSAGHAGSVSFFGKLIDEHKDLKGVNCLDTSVWQEFIGSGDIMEEVLEWVPMKTMTAILIAPYEKKKSYPQDTLDLIHDSNEILYDELLCNNEPVKSTNDELFEFLAAEGAAMALGKGLFKIRSPLVKNLLLYKLLPKMHPNRIIELVPMKNNTIDVPNMLQVAIKHWNREWLVTNGYLSCKGSRAIGIERGVEVPSEEVYQSVLFTSLRSWLRRTYTLCSQVKVRMQNPTPDKSCDIWIAKGPDRILFELVAHTNVKDVSEHISRVKKYAEILKPSVIYVLHFTTSLRIKEYPFCDEKDTVSFEMDCEGKEEEVTVPVHIIHFQHTSVFDEVKMYSSKEEDPITLKLK